MIEKKNFYVFLSKSLKFNMLNKLIIGNIIINYYNYIKKKL